MLISNSQKLKMKILIHEKIYIIFCICFWTLLIFWDQKLNLSTLEGEGEGGGGGILQVAL